MQVCSAAPLALVHSAALGVRSVASSNTSTQAREPDINFHRHVELVSLLLSQQAPLAFDENETLNLIEDELINLDNIGANSTGDVRSKFADVLKKLADNMKHNLMRAHRADQSQLRRFRAHLVHCNRKYKRRLRRSTKRFKFLKRMRDTHVQCRVKEAEYSNKVNTCNVQLNEFLQAKQAAGSAVTGLNNGLDSLSKSMCGGWSSSVSYAKLKSRQFAAASTTFGKIEASFASSKRQYAKKKKSCTNKASKMSAFHSSCDTLQTRFMSELCKQRTKAHLRFKVYRQCYEKRRVAYSALYKKVKKTEGARKREWRSMRRLLCLTSACLSSQESKKDILKDCRKKHISTSRMELSFVKAPKFITNKGLRNLPDPCSTQFKAIALSSVPTSIQLRQCLSCPLPTPRLRPKTPQRKYCVRLETAGHREYRGKVALVVNSQVRYRGHVKLVTRCLKLRRQPEVQVRGFNRQGWLGSISLWKGGTWSPMLRKGRATTAVWIGSGSPPSKLKSYPTCAWKRLCGVKPGGTCITLNTTQEGAVKLKFNGRQALSGRLRPGWKIQRCTGHEYPKIEIVGRETSTWEGSVFAQNVRSKWDARPLYLRGQPTTSIRVGKGKDSKALCTRGCRLRFYRRKRCSKYVVINGRRVLVSTSCRSKSAKRFSCGPGCTRRKLRRRNRRRRERKRDRLKRWRRNEGTRVPARVSWSRRGPHRRRRRRLSSYLPSHRRRRVSSYRSNRRRYSSRYQSTRRRQSRSRRGHWSRLRSKRLNDWRASRRSRRGREKPLRDSRRRWSLN